MLNHYNHTVVGCFKEIFWGVDTNNLATVLQDLKELNFILANRTPKLSTHYGFPLKPHLISAEEVPDFISTYLSRPAANPPEHSSRRPRTRGNHQYRPSRQLSHTLILIDYVKKKGLLINPDIVTVTGVTGIHH